MKIALLCPTRNRVGDVKRLIKSIERTAYRFNTFILYLGIDEDDPARDMFTDQVLLKRYIKIIDIPNNGKFIGLGKLWNIMASQVSEEILAMVGDDMVFETPNWDLKILREFNMKNRPVDGIKMVHCNDGIHGPGNRHPDKYLVPVNSFIYRTYYDVNGYYTRDELTHQYLDTWLGELFEALGRKTYRHDIMIRHLHFSQTGKVDKVTETLRANSDPGQVKRQYYELKPERDIELTRVKKHINESN